MKAELQLVRLRYRRHSISWMDYVSTHDIDVSVGSTSLIFPEVVPTPAK